MSKSATQSDAITRMETFVKRYRSHCDLPPLVGIASFTEAVQPGLSVEESVRRLKRHHYLLRRLHHLWIARLTSEPLYELKMAYSYHAFLASEATTLLRNRVGEMREPPLGLERIPHPSLEILMDELLQSPTTEILLLGVYELLLPALLKAMQAHHRDSHVLADQMTRRILQQALNDLEEMIRYGSSAVQILVTKETRHAASSQMELIRQWMGAAGGLDGTDLKGEADRIQTAIPPRHYSAQPFQYDGVPRRDERFPDPYNMGVNAEVFLYDEKMPADAKVLMMFYKRIREIDVPEMMASILAETPGKPWGYYRDMTRQLWDEARHAMMGEVGFASVGVDWPSAVKVNFTWSLGLNTQLKPKERHAVLYFIEQGLMPRTGKRHEWEVSIMSENPLAATFQDFDWADEVLHARVGRDWYVSDMPSAHEAVAYGDRCWSEVLMGWKSWKDQGHTTHENWWPEVYRQYCAHHGVVPDEGAMAFCTSYENTRADLKQLADKEVE